MDNRRIASGTAGTALPNRNGPRRLAALCGAAIAAALFTPVPADADIGAGPTMHLVAASATAPWSAAAGGPVTGPAERGGTPDSMTMSRQLLARSLISTGMVGIGLALGGLVIVTHRRRQW